MSNPKVPSGNADEPVDILELGAPGRRHRTLGRLGLMMLATAAGLSLISLILTSTSAGGFLDLLVFILWLGSASLAIAGVGLVAIAGFKALMQKVPFSSLI